MAGILGYDRPTKAILDHVDDENKDEVPIQDSIGRMQKTLIINEFGLYSLILSSKLPSAKKFKHWVTSEVLPSIKNYIIADLITAVQNGKAYEEAVNEAYTRIYQSTNSSYTPNTEIGVDRIYLDFPTTDAVMFRMARKLLLESVPQD